LRLNHAGTLIGFAVLWVPAQFLGGLDGFYPALFTAVLIGILGSLAARFFSILNEPAWLLPVMLGGCSLLGLGAVFLVGRFSPAEWVAAPGCLLASSAVVALQTIRRKRCALCNRRLSLSAITFHCPRCALEVCEESCWSFEHRRCQLCVEHRVPLLSAQKQWWDRALGPAALQGRCQVCMASFEQAELRSCGRCRRPQCRDCWDNLNGECARCSWTVPDLPESLKRINPPPSGALSSQHYE
jgi:hypothetical protein